jgi:putative flippase GtrA
MILSNKQERTRFFRFAIVGAIGALIDFGVFNLLIWLTGLASIYSSMISFTLAVGSNFVWNRYWTYPDSRTKHFSRQFIQFVVVSVVGLLIRTPLFAWLETNLIQLFSSVLPSNTISPVFLGHNVSLAIAILVVMIWNFIANRYWTYNDVKIA